MGLHSIIRQEIIGNKLTAGFAEKSFSCLDATLTDGLHGAGVRGTRIVQIGCNNEREVL